MKIEVYTQPNCPPCQWVKNFLADKDLPYIEYDVSKDTHARKRLMMDYDCFSTPTVIINSEKILTGSDISKLEELF